MDLLKNEKDTRREGCSKISLICLWEHKKGEFGWFWTTCIFRCSWSIKFPNIKYICMWRAWSSEMSVGLKRILELWQFHLRNGRHDELSAKHFVSTTRCSEKFSLKLSTSIAVLQDAEFEELKNVNGSDQNLKKGAPPTFGSSPVFHCCCQSGDLKFCAQPEFTIHFPKFLTQKDLRWLGMIQDYTKQPRKSKDNGHVLISLFQMSLFTSPKQLKIGSITIPKVDISWRQSSKMGVLKVSDWDDICIIRQIDITPGGGWDWSG